ncbi:MAG TPA: hypothetical protein VN675_03655 [Burkholderiales bacterium]|nr:hypothetical protein [Burkholderiales bacterium]
MGYRIEYAVRGGTMQARVSGRSTLAHAARIARDIAEEATQRAAKQLLIDVRGLVDRVGTLSTLMLGACGPARVALVDTMDNDRWHILSEGLARRRGYALRCFNDANSAIAWLQGR